MSKPVYDLGAGEYRVLVGPDQGEYFGPSHPQEPATESRPAVGEWYRRRVLARTRITTKVRGRKRPRIVTEREDAEATVGLILGLGALTLGWEVGTSIAHGLQGVDPLSWAGDVENWLTGKSNKPPTSASTIGGRLQLAVLDFLEGTPPPTSQTSSSGSSGSTGGVGGGPVITPHLLPILE